jgi:hypothetical protein
LRWISRLSTDLVSVPSGHDAAAFIRAALAELDAELRVPRTTGPATSEKRRDFEHLLVEIRRLSTVVWLVFGALATALGSTFWS